MSWLRYGWGNVQPQSTMVESLASSKEMPKQTQWYHSKQVRHCTISLRLECWVLNPRQNTHKKASNAPHFHGRRGHIWLKVFPCSVSGSQMMMCCTIQPQTVHNAVVSVSSKSQQQRLRARVLKKNCRCQYCNANLPGETS